MKKFLKLKGIALFSIVALGFVSCSDDDNSVDPQPDQTDKTIVELASGDENLTSLVAALKQADLVATLEGAGPYTVLAPTNEAFADFLEDEGYDNLEAIPKEALQQILLNHVIAESISAAQLITNKAGYTKTLALAPLGGADANMSLYYDTSDDVEFNGDSEVVDGGADIMASNGIIHIVDDVIALPTVATFIDADPRFDTLDDVLDSDGQPDFETILKTSAETPPAPFTVFAPVNEAFTALAEVPTGADLTAVLQHHVIGESNILSTAIEDGLESPATLEGDVLTFTVVDGAVTITDGAGNATSTVTEVDLQASNGVLHAISAVLIPNTENVADAVVGK